MDGKKIPERWPTKRHFATLLGTCCRRQLSPKVTRVMDHFSSSSSSLFPICRCCCAEKGVSSFLFSYLYIHLLNPIPSVFLAFSPRLIVSGYTPSSLHLIWWTWIALRSFERRREVPLAVQFFFFVFFFLRKGKKKYCTGTTQSGTTSITTATKHLKMWNIWYCLYITNT